MIGIWHRNYQIADHFFFRPLTYFKVQKKPHYRGKDTGDRGITECIRADMIAFMTKSGSMWFDASNDSDQQHISI
ncbi:hypothetical protein DB330_11805 [Lacticaseibacillus casei]|nr:hypothetical protein [Lacticaseibacillus casei]PTU92482.1 hypothetical protein DB330_11805 [Lacticaseibacillus casei]